MVTVNQVINGVLRYIDAEILPHLTGAKRFGVAMYAALMAQNAPGKVMEMLQSPPLSLLGLADDNGNIDLDRIRAAAIQQMHGDKIDIDIPAVGRFAFSASDIERVCEEIRKA